MIKKNILFVVSDYLPNRSGGTLRVEKNIKYLKEELNCFVFCPDLKNNGKHSIIEDVEVLRTKNLDASYLYYLILNKIKIESFSQKFRSRKPQNNTSSSKKYSRASERYLVPDVYILWVFNCFYKLYQVIKKKNIDIVYSSSPAASNHLIVLFSRVFFRNKVLWVSEFRDPWITNPFRKPKMFLLENLDRWLEKKVILTSDVIIVTSLDYKEDFRRRYGNSVSQKVYYHPNGYDNSDFSIKVDAKGGNKKIIFSAGNYYSDRSLLPFLVAFNEASKILGPNQKFEFIHYGEVDYDAKKYLDNNDIHGVQIHNAISHSKCIVEMQKSDLLLLIPGPGKGTVPGKTFEYLAVYKPIISLIDEDTPVSKIIKSLNVGPIIKTTDINSIANYLVDFNDVEFEHVDKSAIDVILAKYDRKSIAKDILRTIELNSIKESLE